MNNVSGGDGWFPYLGLSLALSLVGPCSVCEPGWMVVVGCGGHSSLFEAICLHWCVGAYSGGYGVQLCGG